MNYFSLNNNAPKSTFKNAVIKGLAPDKGLYYPENIRPLDPSFIANLSQYSNKEIAYKAIEQFVGNEIDTETLKQIVNDTLNFDFPLVKMGDSNDFSLELFHGPTMAFKDVGARFMARCLGYFNKEEENLDIRVLVATSGDTGGAVASGFLGVEGVKVIILYPKGKVSDIQEKQLTTLGQNIQALEVKGVFDDCQDMVKMAFLDNELQHKGLTSANSINVARWLPQMWYYFFAYKQLQQKELPLYVSVPSGNFGNICAGMVARELGLPIHHFVAATNSNDTIPRFLQSGLYEPENSKATISNAMDVGNPSNFVRIRKMMNNDIHKLKTIFSSYSFSDKETKLGMKELYKKFGYISDPHGAVAYLGLRKEVENNTDYNGIFLETAHPVKFLDIVKETLKIKVEIPVQIAAIMDGTKSTSEIKDYKELKSFILNS
ncbi:MAG: threonine synthase [Flavobacteriaceae bacterium]|nr:threonine synthase [Flavobacteriaceae bacterium]